jgi:hypothetical protein
LQGKVDDYDADALPISPEEAAASLAAIRRYMGRSTEFAHYSAASGFIAGVATLAGCAWLLVRRGLDVPPAWEFAAVWGAVAVLALTGAVITTVRRARARGDAVLDTPTRMVLGALAPAAFITVVLTIALSVRGHTALLPGVWLLCYGTGIYAAALFARREFQVVGLSALALGGLALVCPAAWGTLFMGLGFGALHLGYGAVAWRLEQQRVQLPSHLRSAA